MLTQKKKSSAFVKKYATEIAKWAINFDAYNCAVIAISRKGPRLLELLKQDGLIGQDVLERTCSEYAIPFLHNTQELSVVDDSVLYGSTLMDTIELIKSKLNLDNNDLNIVPLRYSSITASSIKELINKEFSCIISSTESFVHINQLVNSFKNIGKPYDLEFPILYLRGDFSDDNMLKQNLESVCRGLDDTSLIINNSPDYPDRYTLLLKAENTREAGAGAEFSKIRVCVNDSKNRIAFVPISPCIISNEELISFGENISPEYRHLWFEIFNQINSTTPDEIEFRSLIVWANYLKSLSFFAKRLPIFQLYFDTEKFEFDIYDLQLLLGFDLPYKVMDGLSTAVAKKKKFVFFIQNHENYGNINEYILPGDKAELFFEFIKIGLEKFRKLNSESEVLNFLFHSQHTQLEMSSRDVENLAPATRLKFGFTLNYLINIIRQQIPDASINKIHGAFDKLIDLGCIVPKYLNLSKDGKTRWGRVYRVGETPPSTPQRVAALLQVCNNLVKFYNNDAIPALVLEKCIVMSLTNSFGFNELNEDGIKVLGITKKFGLYGARSYVLTDHAGPIGTYFLTYGKTLGVIRQNRDEDYFINKDILKTYDQRESALSETASDKIEDIAKFCHFIATKGSAEYLVLFTTLASKKELWLALSAELQLWLAHPNSGIITCIHKLIEIRNKIEKGEDVTSSLQICNSILKDSANFTAQVKSKISTFDNYENIKENTEQLIQEEGDSNISRVWRSLKTYLTNQTADSTGLYYKDEITEALRFCHRVTSLCRTLLNRAGFPDTSGSKRNVGNYLNAILEQLEVLGNTGIVGRTFEQAKISDCLKNVIVKYDEGKDFVTNFDLIQPFLFDIADSINNIYEACGSSMVKPLSYKIMEPPVFIVMWDMLESTQSASREVTEKTVIIPIKEQLVAILGEKMLMKIEIKDGDDGGVFLTRSFNDVLMAFSIIHQKATQAGVSMRVGCETNTLGELREDAERGIIAGRAYEFAARLTSFFKEVGNNPMLWEGDLVKEPIGCYLILSEFVKRYALQQKAWNLKGYKEITMPGKYSPRVRPGTYFPYSISILSPDPISSP